MWWWQITIFGKVCDFFRQLLILGKLDSLDLVKHQRTVV